MTDTDTRTSATRASRASVLAWAAVAMLLALGAPAISLLFTTGLRGTGASVKFPHGYVLTLIMSIIVTAAACAIGARLAGRFAIGPMRFALMCWGVIGFAVAVAGVSLGHTHLTEWGIAVVAAALAGAAVGIPLAARQ